ncbi:DUF4837 family protein [Gemmatimonadota bacterium]
MQINRFTQSAGSAVAVVVVALAVVGCARPRRNAIGDAKQIVVFADPQTWEYYGEALAAIFERRVNTPREELIFEVRHQDLESWDFFRRYKHVVLCASLEDGTPAAARINDLLTPEARESVRQQNGGIAIERVDLFAPGQLFTILTGPTREGLQSYLSSASEALFESYDNHYSEHLLELIYRQRERYALEDSLFDRFQFLVRVPYEYRMDDSRAEEGFVRMIKYLPQRFFFAWWAPQHELAERGLEWTDRIEELGRLIDSDQDPSPDLITSLGRAAMDLRDAMGREFYDGDEVVRERTTATVVKLGDRWALRLYGVWANMQTVVGGPLVAYCFLDPQTGRLWWLDGAVFAPELQEKEIYLRQMDVMLNTFLSGPDARAYVESLPGGARGRR